MGWIFWRNGSNLRFETKTPTVKKNQQICLKSECFVVEKILLLKNNLLGWFFSPWVELTRALAKLDDSGLCCCVVVLLCCCVVVLLCCSVGVLLCCCVASVATLDSGVLMGSVELMLVVVVLELGKICLGNTTFQWGKSMLCWNNVDCHKLVRLSWMVEMILRNSSEVPCTCRQIKKLQRP